MLKLVDGDNDKVIGELADNTAVLGFGPNNETYIFVPRFKDGRVLPNVVLAECLSVYLRDRDKVRDVLTYQPPQPAKSTYKGNN